MKKKFELILNNAKPFCKWPTYFNENTYISSIYSVKDKINNLNVDLSDTDEIINQIHNQDLTLIFFKTTIKILGNAQIQEYNKGILLDSKLNIKHVIKIGSFQISYFGDIKNDRNQIMKKGKYRMPNEPSYSEHRVSCPSENEYLKHYNTLLSSLNEFILDPFKFFP